MNEFETYRAMLKPDKHALDVALEMQPEVLERIGNQIARLEQRNNMLREQRKTIESRLVAKFRDEGATVPTAEALMRVKDERIEALNNESDSDRELAEWKALNAAWLARGYVLKDLVVLFTAQYFTPDRTTQIVRRDRPDYVAQRREERSRELVDAPPSKGRVRV